MILDRAATQAGLLDALATEPNRYATPCARCGELVAGGTGVLYPGPPPRVFHVEHAPAGAAADRWAAKFAADGRALRDYQRRGVRWLAGRRTGLLADDQGVGKTPTVIGALDDGPALLVVCPKIAKGTWEHHARWRDDLKPMSVRGRGQFRWPERGEALIYNYDILPAATKLPTLPAHRVDVVADEAHYCKTPETKRTTATQGICKAAAERDGRVWLVTGTPQKKDPRDLFTVLSLAGLHGEAGWPDFESFRLDFGGTFGPWGLDWPSEPPKEKQDLIAENLRKVMLRRLKADVMPELPPKQWVDLEVEISREAAREADKAVEALKALGIDLEKVTLETLQAASEGPAFHEVSRARNALAQAKVPAMLEVLREHEAAYPSDPILCWSVHKAPLRALREAMGAGWDLIIGQETSESKVKRLVAAFQEGRLRGLGLTLAKGATSLTLTRAWRAVFVDMLYTPADNVQAEDRIHRFGQTWPVIYTRLWARHAIDRRVRELLAERTSMAQATIDRAAVR